VYKGDCQLVDTRETVRTDVHGLEHMNSKLHGSSALLLGSAVKLLASAHT